MKLLQHFKELTIRPKNAQELKGLILQLAIQGKLTANWRAENPDIEPASELLEKIIKNKEDLVKSKIARKEIAKKEFLKEEVSFKIPETWISKNITEFYYTIGGKSNQIKSKNYNERGKYPIVSQGKNKIDGYSDDESKLLKLAKPVVVFGDHTRQVKFIDFDFIIGADGTKILNPYDGIDSQFFYLHISFFDLSNKGYARHYSLLKLKAFCLPPLEEQKEIVRVVETLFKEVEQLEQLTVKRIGLKEDFVTSALHQLTTKNANQEWKFLQEHFKSFFNETTNIKKLRETVLQLAVQGKLTANWRVNNPDTEDASQLLKQIQEEKAQLIAAKKIKKEKVLPPITKDEIPYEVPEGWVWVNFGDLATFINGDRGKNYPNKSEYVDEGVAWINTGHINPDGTLSESKMNYITEDKFDILRGGKIQDGDLVYCLRGATFGKTAYVSPFKKGAIASSLMIIRAYIQDSSGFIYRFLISPEGKRQLLRFDNGSAQPNLSANKVKLYAFPLPPLEEQKAIVAKVNALMELCDKLEEEVQQSQAYSTQLMQSCLREVFETS
ncbi:restriction endonuclease subunit S [Kordia algicida OT-1]|uniref:Type I restriction modification DNA specificity domain-containing protein n=1 Tax=Kordia algicida OT-1 TaxID=391587 RepID=A9E5C9_9FLAO|nr:restriction endonuclease subunit S [Kordia algicida]EDP95165.1 hypothetical protein KAOT1_06767 [Kordia algicida OT-1]